jgi:hypothetical protein
MTRLSALLCALLVSLPCSAHMSFFDAWLGTWERTHASGRLTRERWWRDGTVLRGDSRELAPGSSEWVQTESLLLTEMLAGTYYIAQPKDNPYPVAFRLISHDGVAIFENAAHDFPQRISYALTANDSLRVWIEGSRDGEPRRIEFLFLRVPENPIAP